MPDQNLPDEALAKSGQPSDPSQSPLSGNTSSDPVTPPRPVLTTEEIPVVTPAQDPSQPTPTTEAPLPIPETSDVPPPPPGSDLTDTAVASGGPVTNTPSSFDLPQVMGAPPKKKFGGKRVISTILGLLLLIGGVGAGVTLVRQQQDIREKAAIVECESGETGTCKGENGCSGTRTCNASSAWGTCKCSSVDDTISDVCKIKFGGSCINAIEAKNKGCETFGAQTCGGANVCAVCKKAPDTNEGDTGDSGGGGNVSTGICSNASAAKCQGGNPGDPCSGIDGTCKDTGKISTGDNKTICSCQIKTTSCKEECPSPSDGILRSCTPPDADGTSVDSICNSVGRVESCGGKSYCCPSVGGTWTTNMSACQGSAQCQNVKAYKGDDTFTPLTTEELKALKAGDKVRFAVAGTATGATGSFDKAKFKINATDSGEVTTKKPSSTEFYFEYTIPAGTTSFNITAQIHHTTLGWSN